MYVYVFLRSVSVILRKTDTSNYVPATYTPFLCHVDAPLQLLDWNAMGRQRYIKGEGVRSWNVILRICFTSNYVHFTSIYVICRSFA